jgi:hypothetical protein
MLSLIDRKSLTRDQLGMMMQGRKAKRNVIGNQIESQDVFLELLFGVVEACMVELPLLQTPLKFPIAARTRSNSSTPRH